ncbi:uncharacterized protein LOC111084895 [Limulus polyphemus]|uniref:Uncharacterized protein LOC111084895 n=1 Tax=Limulus polyphemus TaxID=6850 RepID=A0ABM1S0E6_LIMPO|nr:uncharacterized protein LOC111084895 [Limulus polyphemus]
MRRETKTGIFLSIVLCFFVAISAEEDLRKFLEEITEKRKTLSYIKSLINKLDNNFVMLKKRTCKMNAGMTHGCDYTEFLKAQQDHEFWANRFSPGRRRREFSFLLKTKRM